MSSFDDFYKKWKEENNITTQSNYNSNISNEERANIANNYLSNSFNNIRNIKPRNNYIDTINTNKNNNNPIWDNIVDIANGIGKTTENTWLGFLNGLQSFQQTLGKRITETQTDRLDFWNQQSKEILESRKEKEPENAEKLDEIINNPLISSSQIKENEKKITEEIQESKDEKTNKINENVEQIDNPVLKKLAEISPSIGQMAPSFIPGFGAIYATGSATGQYYDDAKARGMSDEEAETYSGIMGLAEGGTEMIGIKNLSKAGKTVKALVKGTGKQAVKEVGEQTTKTLVKQALKEYGIGIADNAIQEAIIEPIQEFTAQTVAGKDKANWENVGGRMIESAINGGLVSAIMGGANLGIQSCTGVVQKYRNNQNITQQEFTKAIKDASKQLDVETMITQNIQNEVSRQQTTLQTTEKQPKNDSSASIQQQNAERLNKIVDNDKFISKEDKNAIKEATNSLLNSNQLDNANMMDAINQIKQMSEMAKAQNNTLDIGKKYLTGRKEIYNKYSKVKNYDNSVVEQAKEVVPANRQGRRTKEQWLQVAKQIGTNVADMSNSEIQKIAYKSWQEGTPNNAGTLNRQGKKYVKFTSDEWIDTIYDQVENIRKQKGYTSQNQTVTDLDTLANELNQIQQSQTIQNQSKTYANTDNMDLRQSANVYGLDSNSETIQSINDKMNDRGIKSRFDETLFKDNKTNAIWKTTKDSNGNIQREVIFNPNADTEKTMQQVSIHEMLHDFEGTKEFNELSNLILEKNRTREGYKEARQQLEDIYSQVYDKNSKEFTDLVNEEEVADTLAQKLGDQDFIDSLNKDKPTVFEKIYDWIMDKLNKITGNRSEKLYWENIRNKFESAYKKDYQGTEVATKLSKTNVSIKDNQGNTLSKQQQEYFKDSKVRDEDGNLKVMYHGTKRADRVGNLFDPNKATSGPMAYFTDSKDIAKNYSENKQDTSLSREYDTEYDLFKVNGKDLDTYWNSLSNKKQQEIAKKANNVGFDDDFETIVYGEKASENSFGDQYEWRLKNEYKGNALKTLYSIWIEDGNLMDSDISKFKEILELSGVENVDYLDPYKTDSKVYEVFINVTKPFDTSNIGDDILNQFKEASKIAKIGEQYSADLWDKSNISPEDWIKRLENDIKEGTTHAWTVIPDWVTNVLKNNGYDGIKDTGGKLGGAEHEVIIPFYSEQIKDINNENPTVNPDIRYSTENGGAWQDFLNEQIGTEGKGQKVKDLRVPTKENYEYVKSKKVLNPTEISNLKEEDASTTPKLPTKQYKKGNVESNFYKNITESSEFLNEDIRKELSKEDNIKYYDKVTNKDTLETAYKELQDGGRNEVLDWFNKNDKNATAKDVAKGWILMKQYQDNGDYQSVVEVAKKMRDIGTTSGQTVQAFNILSRLTPEGMTYYAQKELSEAYDLMVKGKSQKWIDQNASDFDLSQNEVAFIQDTMEKVSKMEDGYDKKVELAKIQKLITDKIPPERGQGIKAWMRISMLFNPKTQVRNVAGNAVILPVNMFSDSVSAGIDKLISKKTGVRTTGLSNLKQYGKGFAKGLYESYNDFKLGINTREIAGNRFEIGQGKSFKNKGIGKALNRVDNLLSFMLDAGDRGFYEATFTNSLNNQMVLNKSTEVTQDMIDIATNEALQRTWQDNNTYTQAVLGIRRILNKASVKGYGLGDVLIPFAKTPANLTKAIVDYSPVGLGKTLAVDSIKLKNAIDTGQFTPKMQHDYVQKIGKGLAGSFLYVLGSALASAGIITGEADDDKDVKNFMKDSLGISNYSIKIGDKTFTYDWAQPVASPFTIMANYQKKKKENPDASAIESAMNVLGTGFDVVLEQSFLESLNTVLNGSGSTIENLQKAVLDLPARAVPTFSKQIADMVDDTQRTTFEYGKPVQSAVNSVVAKIPFASKTLAPTRDTLGREVKKYGGENNFFNVFINPANTNKGQETKAGKEIYRLYQETGETTMFPITAPYYINNDGEKITMDSNQRAEFQKITGQYTKKAIDDLLSNASYKTLSDDKKVELISDIVSDSNAKAKYEVLGIETEDAKKKREYIEKITPKVYYDFSFKTKDIEGEDATKKKLKILEEANYSDSAKKTIYQEKLGKSDELYKNVLSKYNINIDEYLGYKQQEFTSDKKDDGTVQGKTITNSKKTKVYDYVNNMRITRTQKILLLGKSYKLNKSEQTELYNYINSIPGQTKKEKLDIFKSYSNNFTVYKNENISYK